MRLLRLSLLFAVTIGVASVTAQTTASKPSAKVKPAAKTSAALRTAWGAPNLEGIWDFRTITPMERPPELAGKATLTAEETAEYERKINEQRNADARHDTKVTGTANGTAVTGDVALAYNDFWWDRGTKVIGTRRTSLVIDPPDGKIPELTAEGKARRDARAAVAERPAWGPEDRAVGERCMLGFNAGPPMNPAAYNMNVQI